MGDFEKALICFKDSFKVKKNIQTERYYFIQVYFIRIYYNLCNYDKALDILERVSKKIESDNSFDSATYKNNIEMICYIYLNLCKKASNQNFKNDMIDSSLEIINTDSIEYELMFHLYNLYNDKLYLEKAYKQVQEKVSLMNDFEKYLNYPTPKAIVEEWEKAK